MNEEKRTLKELLSELENMENAPSRNRLRARRPHAKVPLGVLAMVIAAGLVIATGTILFFVNKDQTVNPVTLAFSPDPANSPATLGQAFTFTVTATGLQ